MRSPLASTWRVLWACARKDILSAMRDRVFTIVGLLLSVTALILMSLFVLAGSHAPTAVVNEDAGPYAAQFVRALAGAHSFRLIPATAALVLALISLLGASLGVALGAVIRRIQTVIAVSILLTLYLFFLSGGLGVLAFAPPWLQSVASFVPLTYGIHALQMALFYDSADRLGLDVIVLVGVSAAMIVLGTLSMRRKMLG